MRRVPTVTNAVVALEHLVDQLPRADVFHIRNDHVLRALRMKMRLDRIVHKGDQARCDDNAVIQLACVCAGIMKHDGSSFGIQEFHKPPLKLEIW